MQNLSARYHRVHTGVMDLGPVSRISQVQKWIFEFTNITNDLSNLYLFHAYEQSTGDEKDNGCQGDL